MLAPRDFGLESAQSVQPLLKIPRIHRVVEPEEFSTILSTNQRDY